MTQGRPMLRPVKGDWQPCPPGELGRLADRLRGRRWGQVLVGAGAALVAAAAVAFAGWQVASVFRPSFADNTPGCPCDGCTSTSAAPSNRSTAP
jgi:hypothetical protein